VSWLYVVFLRLRSEDDGLMIRRIDTKTAIFMETTEHMTPREVLEERHPFGGPGVPNDIAKMAVVLASDDASWVTGVNLPVDGGYTAR
jgi:NAD(P)-dependent dehydrogenase (short-subunit alcohol dehydrogenase family)